MLSYNITMVILVSVQVVLGTFALAFILTSVVEAVKLYRQHRKIMKYIGLWHYKFIKQKPVLTFRIKRLLSFIRRFGIKVKVVGINYFVLEINGSHCDRQTNTIVFCPNGIHATNQEASILCTLAHEFGHAFANLIGKDYPRCIWAGKAAFANPKGIIQDEQQAWHYAHKCLQRLFPNDRDLAKNLYGIYDVCMASYLKSYYTMEALNERKKKKTDDENPFAP